MCLRVLAILGTSSLMKRWLLIVFGTVSVYYAFVIDLNYRFHITLKVTVLGGMALEAFQISTICK